MTIHFDKIHTIYVSGIGGIGTSALAQLLHADKKKVSGSDAISSSITDCLQKKGIAVFIGQNKTLFTKNTDLLIYSDAVPEHHPDRKKAQELGIPQLSYFEALGEYIRQFKTVIAVSGTHGKSTTTAMIANMCIAAQLNPTVIVGSVVKEFGSNARKGAKDLCIVEACEHREHMLHLHPHIIVLTNIEEDHLDYYHDLDHIILTFQKYINHLPMNGVLIKNNDDAGSHDIGFDGRIITYGMTHDSDIFAKNMNTLDQIQTFRHGETTFELPIPGVFNMYNALAAIAVGKHLGISEQTMHNVLRTFRGVWRRFEIMGAYKGALVISDYAHHPTAIQKTIQAAREFYPNRRIGVIFQPHQRSRTQKLFSQFVKAFTNADFVIVQEIYDVLGRENEENQISSQDLVNEIEKKGKYAVYSRNANETREKVNIFLEQGDVLLIMGAGDIYQLAETLVK
ncbi:MAG TPA: UDP-N-acetylmuramate--L-alanine ligase [Patescibacteria group bacterium]|nr:UDP-N-acetylmuramate--L-alanine ligase [Patescibacteria group bacterium]